MEIGDIVKFRDLLYDDERDARYRIVEINGDRAIIQFVCTLPFPPQSVAKISELQVVPEGPPDPGGTGELKRGNE